MALWERDDEWFGADYHRHARRPSPFRHDSAHAARRALLNPDHFQTAFRHRSRSQGHNPRPNIAIFNHLDDHGAALTAVPPHSSHFAYTQWLEEQRRLDQLKVSRRHSRSRSRSRSGSPSFYQLQRMQDRIHELENRHHLEAEEDRVRAEVELKMLRESLSRKDENGRFQREEDKWKTEWKLRQAKEEARRMREEIEVEDHKGAVIAEYENEKRKKEAAEKAAVAEYERKKLEAEKRAKEEEEALIAKLKRKEMEEKEEEEKAYQAFLLKQKEKEIKKKEEQEKREKEIAEAMADRLSAFGFQKNQIDTMVHPETAKKLQAAQSATRPLSYHHHYGPTYLKVHCDHISVDTLKYYKIPYEYDRVRERLPRHDWCSYDYTWS